MAIRYSAGEVLKIAVNIEQNGARFYRGMVEKSRSHPAREMFQFLSDAEVEHEKIFKDFLKNAPSVPLTESYPGELDLYLKAIADALIFTQDKAIKAVEAGKLNDREAVDIGIQVEKDSILYYTEVIRFVAEEDKESVRKVIDEEKNHLVQLLDISHNL